MSPEWSDFILSPDIPHSEANILVFDCLHIESNGWDGGHNLTKLQFVKNSGLKQIRLPRDIEREREKEREKERKRERKKREGEFRFSFYLSCSI